MINHPKSLIVQTMNATKIIEEIAQLLKSEKRKVVEFVRYLTSAEKIVAINELLGEGHSVRNATVLSVVLDKGC